MTRLHAFPEEHGRGPVRAYNAGWGGLPDGEASLTRVLVRAGFRPFYRELHVTCEGERFPPPLAPAPRGLGAVRVEVGPTRGVQREIEIRLLRGGEELGNCIHSTLGNLTDHPDAARWGYIHWLGTAAPVRRRGVARHLLTRALHDLAAQGCTGCWLTTGAANWEAQPLYLSLDFEIVDTSACYVRPLSAPTA
jgi:ribosomal protein S18 acetylase RimI-like enzyme